MTNELTSIIDNFLLRKITAVNFCEDYIRKYQKIRDENMMNYKDDWTLGGYLSTIFSIADMFTENEPRYEGELDADQLYKVIFNERENLMRSMH